MTDEIKYEGELATLNGTVTAVEESVKGSENVKHLEDLKAAETAGKNRVGVIKAIDERLADLNKPPADEDKGEADGEVVKTTLEEGKQLLHDRPEVSSVQTEEGTLTRDGLQS